MAGELTLRFWDAGLTVVAAVLNATLTQRWNGTAMVNVSSVADADWADGLVSCPEVVTDDNTGTKLYVGDLPATLPAGLYNIEFYDTTPTPATDPIGIQTVDTRTDTPTILDAISDLQAHGDTYWAGSVVGTGAVAVNHNYTGTDAYAYQTEDGTGIDNAMIEIHRTEAYNAGHRVPLYTIFTDVDGRWTLTAMLDPGEYTLVAYKQGVFGPNITALTVATPS